MAMIARRVALVLIATSSVNSDQFSSTAWVQNMANICTSDPDFYKPYSLGCVWKNLSASGDSADVSYQSTFANVVPKLLTKGLRLLKPSKEEDTFQILKPMNGCLNPGEQIFGPVVTVTKFKSADEVINMANDSEYGLAAGIHTSNINTALKVADRVNAGTVWINTYNDFHHAVPFGGFNASGLGREMSVDALQNYLQVKAVRAKLDE